MNCPCPCLALSVCSMTPPLNFGMHCPACPSVHLRLCQYCPGPRGAVWSAGHRDSGRTTRAQGLFLYRTPIVPSLRMIIVAQNTYMGGWGWKHDVPCCFKAYFGPLNSFLRSIISQNQPLHKFQGQKGPRTSMPPARLLASAPFRCCAPLVALQGCAHEQEHNLPHDLRWIFCRLSALGAANGRNEWHGSHASGYSDVPARTETSG